jgi:hypothetical protein
VRKPDGAGGLSGHYDELCKSHFTEAMCTQHYKNFWTSTADITTSGVVFFTGMEKRQAENDDLGEMLRAQSTFLESVFCRGVDRFQTYVVELVADIFGSRPEMIPDIKISSREIFQTNDITDLQKRIIEEAASRYSYLNIVDLSLELEKKFSFSLFSSHLSMLRTRRIIEIRNILVHARGVINRQFISKVGATADQIGTQVSLPHPIMTDHYLHSIAVKIDRNAIEKFRLKTIYQDA